MKSSIHPQLQMRNNSNRIATRPSFGTMSRSSFSRFHAREITRLKAKKTSHHPNSLTSLHFPLHGYVHRGLIHPHAQSNMAVHLTSSFLRILQAQFMILCFGYFKEIANIAAYFILVENSKLTLIDVNNTLWRRLAIPGSRSSSSLAMSSELDCDMIVLYWFADPLLLPKKCKEEWQIDSDIFQLDEGKMSNHITSVLNI